MWRKNETINHIVSECSKLAQKEYKSRFDWVGKVMNWKLFKRLKFDSITTWYMYKPDSVLENETHKINKNNSSNSVKKTRPCANYKMNK